MSQDLKLVFAGSMGAGKTTAIRTISEIVPITTEVGNTDLSEFAKDETTVAMDYGELTLRSGEKLGLYGTPGQVRFDFMWRIVATGALGAVILIDNSRPDPLADLNRYVSAFHDLAASGALVVAVGRMDTHPSPSLEDYFARLDEMQLMVPVMPGDMRERADVLDVLDVLFHQIESTDIGAQVADDWLALIESAARTRP